VSWSPTATSSRNARSVTCGTSSRNVRTYMQSRASPVPSFDW